MKPLDDTKAEKKLMYFTFNHDYGKKDKLDDILYVLVGSAGLGNSKHNDVTKEYEKAKKKIKALILKETINGANSFVNELFKEMASQENNVVNRNQISSMLSTWQAALKEQDKKL